MSPRRALRSSRPMIPILQLILAILTALLLFIQQLTA